MFLPEKKKKYNEKDILALLDKHCKLEYELIESLKQDDSEIIKKHVNNLRELRNETVKNFKIEQDSLDDFDLKISEKKIDKSLIESYEKAKNEILVLYKFIYTYNSTPVLNIDNIKNFLVDFSSLIKTSFDIPFEDINGSIVVLSNKSDNNSLILKNKKKIIITDRNYNFTEFSSEELIEILKYFDVYVSDNRYDHIRTEITKQLTLISQISPVK